MWMVLSLSQMVLAQNQNRIDSLNQELQHELMKSTSSKKASLYLELALEYADHDNLKSLEYINKAFDLAIELRDSVEIIHIGRIKGQLLRRVERIDESIALFETLLPAARKLNRIQDLKIILNSLALSYTMTADYYKALDLNFQSLVIREQEGDKTEISISQNNIGLVYFKLKNYEKAIEYYQLALENKRAANDSYDLDRLLVNLTLCYINLGRYPEAKEMIDEVEKLCKNGCREEIQIEIRFSQGQIAFGLEQYEISRQYFTESYALSLSNDNKRFQVENLFYLGKIDFVSKWYNDAELKFQKAQEIATLYGYNQLLINIYREFATLYAATNEFERVAEFQDQYIALKDSLIGEELVKNIASIQTQFEERKNRATIATKEEELVRQRTLNVAIGIIAFLSGLLVFVLYRNNKIIKRVNSALADANSVIEHQHQKLQTHADQLQSEVDKATWQLQQVNASLTKANEEMDHLIYKTSHDIRGPLASLKGVCNVALLDIKDTQALEYIHKLNDTAILLDRILTRLQIVNQVNRAAINREKVNLAELADEIIQSKANKGLPPGMTIERAIPAGLSLISDAILLHIILENLVDNAIKFYSDSQKVQPKVIIRMSKDDQHFQLSVLDNGIGITEEDFEKIFQMFSRASERSSTGGLGLYLVKLVSNKLGGDVTAHRDPEGYTEFRVVIPVAPESKNLSQEA
jgi:signal transduction histidine kinase